MLLRQRPEDGPRPSLWGGEYGSRWAPWNTYSKCGNSACRACKRPLERCLGEESQGGRHPGPGLHPSLSSPAPLGVDGLMPGHAQTTSTGARGAAAHPFPCLTQPPGHKV